MLALRKIRAEPGLDLVEVAAPTAPVADEVLVRVAAAGICGSDVHIEEWTTGYEWMEPSFPVTIGHEFAGRIESVGPLVAGLRPGSRVTVMPSVTCGRCAHCVGGTYDECTTRSGIGMARQGAFASHVIAPARNCISIPDGVGDDIAALAEPLTIGAQAVRTAEVAKGDRVLVLGPGTIGQSAALMAREAGAEVTVAGRDDAPRLAVVRALGFDDAVDTAGRSLDAALGGRRFHKVLEATGAPAVINEALGLLHPGGILGVIGIHPAQAAVDLVRVVRSRLQIRGSYRAKRAVWDEVMVFLAKRGAGIEPMITHRLALTDSLAGFELAHRRIASKVIIKP